jgi:SAM-dependent methyltransferase
LNSPADADGEVGDVGTVVEVLPPDGIEVEKWHQVQVMQQKPNELTNTEFWNNVYTPERESPDTRQIRVFPAKHGMLGRRGYIFRMARRHLGELARKSVLEIGGGGGAYFLLALAKWGGARAFAVDYSPVALDLTKAVFAKNSCAVETYLGDIFEWNPPNGKQFEMIVHWGLMEHFNDPTPLLRVCYKLLAPGGSLLFSMPNMQAWGAWFWRHWCPKNWSVHIYHSDESVRAACAAAGLELQKHFFFGPPLLQTGPWERPGLLPALVSKGNYVFAGLYSLFPLFSRGLRALSYHRGFLAVKPLA